MFRQPLIVMAGLNPAISRRTMRVPGEITGSCPMGANISAREGESPGPRPPIVITGLDPVISHGTQIVRGEMEGPAQAMTLRGWRPKVRAPRRGYVGAHGGEPGDDGGRTAD